MIAQETIQKIYDTAQIEEVVEKFVVLKRSGSTLKAKSPFTNEKTPSFYVVPSKNIFKCFSSGKGGGPIDFLKEMKMTFPEAINYLASMYNINVVQMGSDDDLDPTSRKRFGLFKIMNDAHAYFQSSFTVRNEHVVKAGTYLVKERGYSKVEIVQKKIGYAPLGSELYGHLLSLGYSHEFIVESGLAVVYDNRVYDFFRDRIMFPIYNITGKVIGFTARQVTPHEKSPKYLHSKVSEIFTKKTEIYGLFEARKTIISNNMVYVTEGPTDKDAMQRHGLPNTIAALGSEISEEVISTLNRTADFIVFCYDGDQAGRKAATKALQHCMSLAVTPRFVFFPEGLDPDMMAKTYGGPALKDYVNQNMINTADAMFWLSGYGSSADTQSKTISIKYVIDLLALMNSNPITKGVLIQELCGKMGVSEKAMHDAVNKAHKSNPNDNAYVPNLEEKEETPKGIIEDKIVTLLKYQSESECADTTVYEFIRGHVLGYNIPFDKYPDLPSMLANNDMKTVVSQLPSIVKYGFMERAPKSMLITVKFLLIKVTELYLEEKAQTDVDTTEIQNALREIKGEVHILTEEAKQNMRSWNPAKGT